LKAALLVLVASACTRPFVFPSLARRRSFERQRLGALLVPSAIDEMRASGFAVLFSRRR
jgi:hypothetical protein